MGEGEPLELGDVLSAVIASDADDRYERNPDTMWASHIGFCPRQLYLSKLGLRDTTDIQGRFAAGRLVQDYIEDRLTEEYPWLETDARAVYEAANIEIVGRPTAYCPETDTVYHVKTRNGWHQFKPPVERHLDQLHAYMAGLDADRGQVIYVSLNDLADIRTWPRRDADAQFEGLDTDRIASLVEKAQAIRSEVLANGIATCAEEIPFDPCGCYFCDSESLSFPDIDDVTVTAPSPTPDETSAVTAGGEQQSAVSADGGAATTQAVAEGETAVVETTGMHVPRELRERDVWVVWDGREKRPLAPWQTGTMYPCEWAASKGVDPRRPYEKARMVAELSVQQIHDAWPFPDEENLPDAVMPAVLLPHTRPDLPLAVVDFDDVRDPETGATSREACVWVNQLNGYTEVSRSGTGLHVYVQAALPADHGAFAASLDDHGSVEVYDGSRFTGGTWRHVAGTPRDEVPNAQPVVEAIVERYSVE